MDRSKANTAPSDPHKPLSRNSPTKPSISLKSHLSFTAEVDISETGVRAVLSQQFGEKPKLHYIWPSSRISFLSTCDN